MREIDYEGCKSNSQIGGAWHKLFSHTPMLTFSEDKNSHRMVALKSGKIRAKIE
jgi:hypothetical protein